MKNTKKREEIKKAVAANPGRPILFFAKLMGCDFVFSYFYDFVTRMIRDGELREVREGRVRRLYPVEDGK